MWLDIARGNKDAVAKASVGRSTSEFLFALKVCGSDNRFVYKPYSHQYPNLIDTRTMILRSSASRASVTSVENKNKSKIDKH